MNPQRFLVYLGPAAFLAQQVSVAVRLLPLLLVGVSPHQLPVTKVMDLLPLLLAADTLLVPRPGLRHTTNLIHQQFNHQLDSFLAIRPLLQETECVCLGGI